MNLLTVNETAKLLRVSPITIRRYIASGRLSAERVGRGVRIRREAVDVFVTPIGAAERDAKEPTPQEAISLLDAVGNIVGIGRSDGPTDIAANKHDYLAEAYLSHKE